MSGASVLAALLILLVMAVIAIVLNPGRDDFQWLIRLRRPGWLIFERWIPLIWALIYGCFYVSALISWNQSRRWDLLAGYLLLFLLVQSSEVVVCKTRRIRNGTTLDFIGWVSGIALALAVAQVSPSAWPLLIPYLIWGPIGTLVSWQMQRLNR